MVPLLPPKITVLASIRVTISGSLCLSTLLDQALCTSVVRCVQSCHCIIHSQQLALWYFTAEDAEEVERYVNDVIVLTAIEAHNERSTRFTQAAFVCLG